MLTKKIKRGVLICLSILLTACTEQHGQTILKLAHGLDANHPTHKAMEYFGERLQVLSKHTMSLDIYPSGQLGPERELIELLQIGSLAITKVSASPMEGFVPDFKVFSIPYIFQNREHYWKVLKSELGKSLLQQGESVRLRGLTYYDAGSRSFYTTQKPVTTPDDLAGLKIRVQESLTSIAMVNTLGGSATPVSWGELYTALQQGVVDGAENNPPSFFLSKHYEVCRYFTLDEHTYVPDILIMSQKIWQGLSPQQQEWVQQAAIESSEYQQTLWQKETQHALNKLIEDGVHIIKPDKQLFQERVVSMHNKYKDTRTGKLLQDIINME